MTTHLGSQAQNVVCENVAEFSVQLTAFDLGEGLVELVGVLLLPFVWMSSKN